MRLLLALAVVAGCSPVMQTRSTPGRADGASYTDAGPLEWGTQPAGGGTALRIESFGGMHLALEAGTHLAVFAPDGHLVGDGDLALDVTLDAPGVYRVGVEADTDLTAICDANCARPEITLGDLLAKLESTQPLHDQIAARLQELVPDPDLQAQLLAQLDTVFADRTALDRFPTVPLRGVGKLRPALGLIPSQTPSPDVVVEGELADLLGACDAHRDPPPPISPQLPQVGYGHFPNGALTDCQFAHSERLAQILTSLAVGNGSVVRYQGAELHTPAELARALLASGHTIEVRNERTYANFLSLTFGGVDVRWPVWLDTGVAAPPYDDLVIPMGHSQHAWRIHGPDVDARVMFYLGISGAAFFPQTQVRPAWTGEVLAPASHDIVATFEWAARYLVRNRAERTTVAAGLPADGYGYVGVCNDSNAVLELATMGTITAFPLLRAASLDTEAPLGDGLDDMLHTLPHDADQDPPNAIARIAAMTPAGCDWDATLDAQLRQIH